MKTLYFELMACGSSKLRFRDLHDSPSAGEIIILGIYIALHVFGIYYLENVLIATLESNCYGPHLVAESRRLQCS